MLSERKDTETVASYAPLIESEPADMATVYITIRKSKDTAIMLGQSHAIQTMDQQLYAIAHVKWSLPKELNESILRIGGFHTVCTFIACISKLCGLKDLLVDSNVSAESTMNLMLAGKQFHRAVRGITIAYECLTQLWLASFLTGIIRSNQGNGLRWRYLKPSGKSSGPHMKLCSQMMLWLKEHLKMLWANQLTNILCHCLRSLMSGGVQHRQLLNIGACSWKLPKSYCLTTVLREMTYGIFIFPLVQR